MRTALKHQGFLTATVFALALAVQVPLVLQNRTDPFASSPVADALSYDEWGLRIAARGFGDEPVFHQSPLFPAMLGTLYALTGPDSRLQAAVWVQAFLTALAIALIVPLGRIYFGSLTAGAVGACLGLLHGPFAFYSLKLLPVPVAMASQAGAMVAVGLAREKHSLARAFVAGVAIGVAALARSEMVILGVLGVLAIVPPTDSGPSRRRPWLLAVALAGGLVVAISPAWIHNLRRDGMVLIASSAGENFFIGSQRGGQGDHTPLHPEAGDIFSQRLLAQRIAEEAERRPLRPSEVSSYWTRRALTEIGAAPLAWLSLEGRKLARILHPGDPTDIYSFPLERSRFLPFLYTLFVPPWGLLLAGAAGIVLAVRGFFRRSWPLIAWTGVQIAVLLVFFVNARLRLPLLFALAPFAGLAATRAIEALRGGRRALGLAAVGVWLTACVAGALLTRPTPRDVVRLASVLSTQDRLDEAIEVLRPAIDGPSPDALALDQAGWVRQKKGDFPAARDLYRKALDRGLPFGRSTSTRTRLGIVLEKLGEIEEAGLAHDAAASAPDANAGTFYERGMFRLRRWDIPGARADLERAVRLDPAWAAPRSALASLEHRGG
jgi:tetratricopeptide (TPR) repeat protein